MNRSFIFPVFHFFLLFLWGVASANAQTFVWGGNNSFTESQFFTSQVNPIPAGDDGMIWEVGVFRDPSGGNWIPTAENVHLWAEHWMALASDTMDKAVPYSFGGQGEVTSSFTNGLRIYFWARNSLNTLGAAAGETLLITGPTSGSDAWLAPHLGSMNPAPTWSTLSATAAVLGRLDTNGSAAGGLVESAAGFYQQLKSEGTFEAQTASWAPRFTIDTQPSHRPIKAGETFTLSVAMLGVGPFTFQ